MVEKMHRCFYNESMKRVIVHSDINHAYAQIEEMKNPAYRKVPMAVGGSEEKRNGIILAKNDLAKRYHIQTGESLREARAKCPDLLIVHPHYEEYIYYTEKIKDIYRQYTDRVESFGLDEAWMDLTHSQRLFGDGVHLASRIQEEVYRKTGMTVSMGVSFNKVFAKLGSDMKKKKGYILIDEENFQDVVWPRPVGDLLMVGHRTEAKLHQMGILTIGDLARADGTLLVRRFGKIGGMLYQFANGLDHSEVKPVGYQREIKSVGNGKTVVRDIENREQLYEVFRVIAESVAARLRDIHSKGSVVSVYMRDTGLCYIGFQQRLSQPTDLADEILHTAMFLARKDPRFDVRYRSVGIRVSDLTKLAYDQPDLFSDPRRREKERRAEAVIEEIRGRYGYHSCGMASVQLDSDLTDFDPKGTHTIHPVGFLDGSISL